MAGRKGSKKPLVAERRHPGSGGKGASGTSRGGTRRKRRTGRRGPAAWFVAVLAWPFRFLLRILWRIGLRLGAVAALSLALTVGYLYLTLPEAEALLDSRARGSVTLLDRDGRPFAWRGDLFGGVITAKTASPHLRHAIIATEDKRFYYHPGIDPIGIAGAIRINLSEGRGPFSGNGGSTITQQTAKLLCLGREFDPDVWDSEAAYEADCRRTTLWRKAKEAVFALAMELKYTKDEILTIYMNRAYLGEGARGFEAAAQRYFGKSASMVNAPEAAMLAGLLKAPTRYAPTNNLDRARARAAMIIGLMEEQGYLTPREAELARANPAELSRAAAQKAGGYFADWVMSQGPEFFTRTTSEDVIIRTTFDAEIQKAAEEALAHVFATRVRPDSRAQAAIVVMSADGAVRAMVGGRQTQVAGAFNRATQALRQTGSAFKPFVYATALELGWSPLDTVIDEPITIRVPGSGVWRPRNYDGRFHGEVTLTDALANSYNIPAVKVAQAVGTDLVARVAREFGIARDIVESPSMALGTSETTLIEMTGAYAGILNGGSAVTPYGLVSLRLRGDDEPVMGTAGGIRERVIREEAARQLVWMMEKVVTEGTGRRARLPDRPAAAKTGTTQGARDAWFIGFTADYVAGVWMGNDDNTPLTGVTGGGLPAEIWRETMVRIHEGLPPRPLPELAPTPRVAEREPGARGGRRQGRGLGALLRQILGGG